MLDFRNTNTLWTSVLVETLVHLGLTTAVVSPGSRSTPLTIAVASHPHITAIPILDERSASFFALGLAKARGLAVVLVCTSGTAGANYFPAIIEAYESQVPLLVLTADRPPELRDCASGQTIDQQKLFGHYVQSYLELALPEASQPQLRYLRQAIAHAWQRCHTPTRGPVHINCPFRDPLPPLADTSAVALASMIDENFFQHLAEAPSDRGSRLSPESFTTPALPVTVGQAERGVIVAGPAQPQDPQAYCTAIAALAKTLRWPVLADGLSPLRNWANLNPYLITAYDSLLRHPHHADSLIPNQVLQLGTLPTSKVLRQWLETTDPIRWVVGHPNRNHDPLHGSVVQLSLSLENLVVTLSSLQRPMTPYCYDWCRREAIARQRLNEQMQALPDQFAGKLSWALPHLLPPQTPLMIANSLPVRDVEWFWPLNDRHIQPFFSRGANGIDGTLSTALGIAHHYHQAVLLTGDLALLHDSNGFLNVSHRPGQLTIVLINNQGGGIFEMLPIAEFDPVFEAFFATPQAVDFAALAAAHGVVHHRFHTWTALGDTLTQPFTARVRLLELISDRKEDTRQRLTLLETLGQFT